MKQKERNAKIYQYVLDAIDFSGYDEPQPTTDLEKVNKVYECFKSEYCIPQNLQRYGNEINVFKEWLMGLPSVINIEYRNHAIIELLQEWEILKKDASETVTDNYLGQWFNRMANHFFHLKKQLNNAKPVKERKTEDVYEIMGDYGQGFEVVTSEDSRKAAIEQLKCYRENEPGVGFTYKKKRVKKSVTAK